MAFYVRVKGYRYVEIVGWVLEARDDQTPNLGLFNSRTQIPDPVYPSLFTHATVINNTKAADAYPYTAGSRDEAVFFIYPSHSANKPNGVYTHAAAESNVRDLVVRVQVTVHLSTGTNRADAPPPVTGSLDEIYYLFYLVRSHSAALLQLDHTTDPSTRGVRPRSASLRRNPASQTKGAEPRLRRQPIPTPPARRLPDVPMRMRARAPVAPVAPPPAARVRKIAIARTACEGNI